MEIQVNWLTEKTVSDDLSTSNDKSVETTYLYFLENGRYVHSKEEYDRLIKLKAFW